MQASKQASKQASSVNPCCLVTGAFVVEENMHVHDIK
jgi:hypothetical protein